MEYPDYQILKIYTGDNINGIPGLPDTQNHWALDSEKRYIKKSTLKIIEHLIPKNGTSKKASDTQKIFNWQP